MLQLTHPKGESREIKMKKRLLVIVVVLMLMVGCTTANVLVPDQENTVTINALSLPDNIDDNWYAHIVFQRGKNELTQTVAVEGKSISTSVQIPIGTWNITLLLVDRDDVTHYQNTLEDITIYPDKPLELDFQLRPANGELEVIIDLEAYPQSDYIHRARVHFNDKYEELKRENATQPLSGEFTIPPGTYDFKVELYLGSFRSSDRVDQGIWKSINIEPLSKQTITWAPHTELLTISADIHVVPAAPTNVSAAHNDNFVIVTWEPNTTEPVLGYHIYWQTSPFEPFELLESVSALTTEFTHYLPTDDDDNLDLPIRAYYAVAPYTEITIGYRTKSAEIVF